MQALEKLPVDPEVKILYRGIKDKTYADNFKIGERYSDAAFLSTSKDPEIVRQDFRGGVEVHIDLSNLDPVAEQHLFPRDVSVFSNAPGEREFLFPPGAFFFVLTRTEAVEPEAWELLDKKKSPLIFGLQVAK